MKNKTLLVMLIAAGAFVLVFIVWLLSDNNTFDENAASSGQASNDTTEENFFESYSECSLLNDKSDESLLTSEDEISFEDSTPASELSEEENNKSDCASEVSGEIQQSSLNGKKINRYVKIVEGGVYRYKITAQRQIGGFSIPVVTTVWFGDEYVSIIENETHNIATEMFITSEGAYMLNLAEGTADLLAAEVVDVPIPDFEGLFFIEDGYTTIGSSLYEYERYEKTDGTIVDYLFVDGELKKAKIYTNIHDYEIISIEITEDISDGRCELPNDLEITDRR